MKKAPKPPYAQVSWLERTFNLFSKIKLRKVGREDIRTYNITSPGNESKVISALKFLGIIGDNGEVNNEKYSAFSYSGEKREEEISKIVKESYQDVFADIPNLEEVNYDTLKNYFISEYTFSGILADAAVKAFIFLCKEAGIKLSESILKKIAKGKKAKSIEEKNNERGKSNQESKKIKELIENSSYDKIIFLTKESTKTEFPITCQEDWEDVKILLGRKIERIFDNQGPRVQEKTEGASSFEESDKVGNV